jgi:hypothetical protein
MCKLLKRFANSKCEAQLAQCNTDLLVKAEKITMLNNDVATLTDQLRAANSVIDDQQMRLDALTVGSDQLVYPYEMPIEAVKDYTWVQTCLGNYRVKFRFYPMDKPVTIPSYEDTLKFIKWDLTDVPPYITDDRDCDKYARRLWSRYAWLTPWNNLGFVDDLSGGHAYNLFITADGRVWIVEPQSDRVWEFNYDKSNGIYDAENGLLLL